MQAAPPPDPITTNHTTIYLREEIVTVPQRDWTGADLVGTTVLGPADPPTDGKSRLWTVRCKRCGRTSTRRTDDLHRATFCRCNIGRHDNRGAKKERNALIVRLHEQGTPTFRLVERFGLTRQRVHAIIKAAAKGDGS